MSFFNSLRLSSVPATAFVVLGMFWGCFAAFVPVIKSQINASDAEFGFLLLGTAIGLTATMFIAPAVDRKLGALALPACSILLAAIFLFPGLTTTHTQFFLIMICAGAASGMVDILMNSRVSEIEASSNTSLMNINHGMFSLSYACSAFLTGFAREANLEPLSVFMGAGFVAICASSFMRMKPVTDTNEPETGKKFPLFTVILCGSIVLIAFLVEAAVETWSALHIERTLNGGAAQGAFGPAMLGITMAIGRFSGQAVSSRISELKTIAGATILCILGVAMIATAQSPSWAYVGFAILGLGVSVIGPMGLALTGKMVSPRQRTAAISRVAVIGFVGFFGAPMLMGLVAESHGLRVAFAGLGIVLVLVFPLLIMIKGKLSSLRETPTQAA